jgi:hypothetical protein
MGAAIRVFLSRSRVPTVADWNAALQREGLDVIIDPFSLLSEDGYRPAFLKGEESGFEWYLSEVSESEETPDYPFKAFVRNCDLRAQLCFTSQANEEVVSAIAGAVLAKLSGGYYWDPETDERFFQNEEAIAVARKVATEKGLA